MTQMTNSQAWEAFYKSGRISDYIAFKNLKNKPATANTPGPMGDNTTDAIDTKRPCSPPATG